MRIRHEQLDAIDDALRAELVDELVAHLRRYFAEAMAPFDDDAARDHVRAMLRRARGHGLGSAADLRRFLNLAASFGWSFDQDQAWIGEYLHDEAVPTPSERLGRVKSRLLRDLHMHQSNNRARQHLR
jgi:hypothetical protein